MASPLPVDGRGSNYCRRGSLSLARAKLQRVAASWPVDDVARDPQHFQNVAHTLHIVPDLFGEEGGPGPGLPEDLRHREVAVGVIEQELEELELSDGERSLLALVADHSPFGVHPQAIEIREALSPEFQPFLVAHHLALDDLDVRLRSPSRDQRQLG